MTSWEWASHRVVLPKPRTARMTTQVTRASRTKDAMNPICVLRSFTSSCVALSITERVPGAIAPVCYTLVFRSQQCFQGRGRHGLGMQKSLGLNTAGPLQEVELCPGLHALGNGGHVEGAGEADDSRDEARAST